MGVRKIKPTSAGKRFQTVDDYSDITKTKPEKSLTKPLAKKAGRSKGTVSVRHKGGAHKRIYRVIDFKRDKDGIPAKVAAIEYDPNRSARIALLHYLDGEKRYILAPEGLRVGDMVESGEDADVKSGNTLPLSKIPVGTVVHNIELKSGKGGQLARSAGSYCQIMAREGDYVTLKMPSGEVRMLNATCRATVGQVGNVEHELISAGKAGKSRWLGVRPTVRGTVMNPVDHPHGGGEGKSGPGRHPVTPWGKPTLGFKTRKKKPSDKLIVKKRKG